MQVTMAGASGTPPAQWRVSEAVFKQIAGFASTLEGGWRESMAVADVTVAMVWPSQPHTGTADEVGRAQSNSNAVVDFVLRALEDTTVLATDRDFLLSNAPEISALMDYWDVVPAFVAKVEASVVVGLRRVWDETSPEEAYAQLLVFQGSPMRHNAADTFFAVPRFWDYANAQPVSENEAVRPECWVKSLYLHSAKSGHDLSRFTQLEKLSGAHRDLTGVAVPESVVGVASLNLYCAKNVPAGLISVALRDRVPSINLDYCDLTGVAVPESLEGMENLILSDTEHVPAGLISCALRDGVTHLDLTGCDLTGVAVPESVVGVASLCLHGAQNIPADLISRAVRDGVTHLDLTGCDLTGVAVPESLRGVFLRLWRATNIPAELISVVKRDGVTLL